MNDEYQTQQYWNNNMKKTELKEIIKEEVIKVLNEERKIRMGNILKDGKNKLEILKQNMKKDGYDI
jgi:hypothetical protein